MAMCGICEGNDNELREDITFIAPADFFIYGTKTGVNHGRPTPHRHHLYFFIALCLSIVYTTTILPHKSWSQGGRGEKVKLCPHLLLWLCAPLLLSLVYYDCSQKKTDLKVTPWVVLHNWRLLHASFSLSHTKPFQKKIRLIIHSHQNLGILIL